MTTYAQISNPELQSRIRIRYATEMSILEGLGFRQLAYKLEMRGPLSAIWYLPVLPLMRRAKEVLVFPFPLHVASANVLLAHSGPPAIADCMGMGVKFYTSFCDHSLLISSTLESHLALQATSPQHSSLQIIRTPPCRALNEAWLSHRRHTAAMETQGKKIAKTSSFADYVEISEREEEDLRYRMRSG